MHQPKCCLCDQNAVAIFFMPGGCVARPDLKSQPLCQHHVIKASPLFGMVLVEDLTVDDEFTKWWDSPYCKR